MEKTNYNLYNLSYEDIQKTINSIPTQGTNPTQTLAEKLIKQLTLKKHTISTAESCTGGMLGKLITDISGASAVYNGGVITYTNKAKINVLGVNTHTIERYSELSAQTAAEMAVCAGKIFGSDFGVSTTGVAGPTGGTDNCPVGCVFVGVFMHGEINVYRLDFGDLFSRDFVREWVCGFVFAKVLKYNS